eukprot:1190445-Lingulodinium_polyedra.AAC.1
MEVASWDCPPGWRHVADVVAGGHCRPPLGQDEERGPHRCEWLRAMEHKMYCGPKWREYCRQESRVADHG